MRSVEHCQRYKTSIKIHPVSQTHGWQIFIYQVTHLGTTVASQQEGLGLSDNQSFLCGVSIFSDYPHHQKISVRFMFLPLPLTKALGMETGLPSAPNS